jgi:hypothetical protein
MEVSGMWLKPQHTWGDRNGGNFQCSVERDMELEADRSVANTSAATYELWDLSHF